MTKLNNPSDIQALKKIYQLTLELEQTAKDHFFPEEKLAQIQFLLSQFTASADESLQKLAEIADHLHPKMTVRHFTNFMIPIERLLGKSVSDSQFVVSKKDQTTPQQKKFPLIFVLDNIRSAFNVGSIYRLADCLGAEALFLCGYTPAPDEKTSLGTDQASLTKHFHRLQDAIIELKDKGYQVCALETANTAQLITSTSFSEKTAFVVGNERFGLEPYQLELVDQVIQLPMFGIKNSLNVSNALSITAYEWVRQRLTQNGK